MECDNCKSCPYWGVVDIDKNDSFVWSCTRNNCIVSVNTNMSSIPMEDYLEIKAQQYGFETYFDYLEYVHKIRF